MRTILTMFFGLIFTINTYSQSVVSGFVFEDKNENGKKDHNEKGILNVAVSNGKDIVLTDKNGHYTINVDTSNFVFVIKP